MFKTSSLITKTMVDAMFYFKKTGKANLKKGENQKCKKTATKTQNFLFFWC